MGKYRNYKRLRASISALAALRQPGVSGICARLSPAPPETRRRFLPDARKTPAGWRPAVARLSCQHARVKRVRAIASYWPVFSVDRSNSEFSSSKGTQEMSLATSLWGVGEEGWGRPSAVRSARMMSCVVVGGAEADRTWKVTSVAGGVAGRKIVACPLLFTKCGISARSRCDG